MKAAAIQAPHETCLNSSSMGKNVKSVTTALKREVGLVSSVSLLVGTMVGSGIFMTPEWVLYYTGSPGASLVIWAACGVLSMLSALCYIELGSVIKESGGEYIYLLKIFGPLPAFLHFYTNEILVRPSSSAAVALSFAKYVVAPFYPGCVPPQVVVKFLAAACIIVVLFINCFSVRLATSTQTFFTAAKVLALVVILTGGTVILLQGQTRNLQNAFHGTAAGFGPVGLAFYQALWAYGGWSNLNSVIEEVKRPEVNLPRAVLISVPLVTFLYVMVNVSYFAAMTSSELLTSGAVAVTWGNKILGTWMWLMPVAVAMSTFGTINGSFFCTSRVCYVAAREGHLPKILSMVHVQCLTPSPSLIFKALLSLCIIVPGNFVKIVNYCSFTTWLSYGMIFSGLVYLRIKEPHLPRSYKVPLAVPVIILVVSAYLILAPIIDSPEIEYLYAVLFILSGIIIYVPLIHFKLHPEFLSKITLYLQLLLQVVPATKNID
ncbi:b(0,+)-type amino acid transporter 1-like [Protopterus annectens]|uniref:b(0,+)-type amino acid transporter 1-like n=1 Tax=Protopterus annectens TaxID=7888 RepID=UPI001CF96342|nr:b(0,+)-type amino acid transporter 1-like [Protopterus annectens]